MKIEFDVELIEEPQWFGDLPREHTEFLNKLSVPNQNKVRALGEADGFHKALPSAAWGLKSMLPRDEARSILRIAGNCYNREVPNLEIENALDLAYKAKSSHPKNRSKGWPSKNEELVRSIVTNSEVKNESDCENKYFIDHVDANTQKVVEMLYDPDDLICIQDRLVMKHPIVGAASKYSAKAENCQFILPSTLKQKVHTYEDGEVSRRCNANIKERKYLVIEFDSTDYDDQFALITHLATFAPLTMVVWSGGKSVHAWFLCQGHADEKLRGFMDYAVALGADSQLWKKTQPARMPGALRNQPEKINNHGQVQRLILFRPAIAKLENWKFDEIPSTDVSKPAEEELPLKKKLKLQHVSEIGFDTRSMDFVERLLMIQSVSVIVAAPGSGKSFFALDLLSCVATGRPWRDRDVEKGGVVYVCLEGVMGFKHRIHGCIQTGQLLHDSPFYLVDYPLNMLNEGDANDLAKVIQETIDSASCEVSCIAIDTLSRSMAGANENAVEDMTQMLKVVELLKAKTKAHIMMIHHCGKDESRGARGHSSLLGAVDTEITLERNNQKKITTAKVTKQKDLSCDGIFPFKLEPIELGKDDKNRVITSCKVEHLDESAAPKAGRPRNHEACELLHVLPQKLVKDWKSAAFEELGVPEGSFGRLKSELIEGVDYTREGGEIVAINQDEIDIIT